MTHQGSQQQIERNEDATLSHPSARARPRQNPAWMRLTGSNVVPQQQFAHITGQDSSHIHAGNSYVGQQNHYYGRTDEQIEKERKEDERLQREHEFQESLAFPAMSLRSAKIAAAQAQTCKWLFETTEYKRWRDATFRPEHHGIFWIKGKPGAGKSTIMKYALSCAQGSQDGGKVISFFYNARGDGLEKSTEGMYRTLLHQMSKEVPELQGMSEQAARWSYKERGWPLELLKDMFREAIRCTTLVSSITCFVDALDECDEDEVRDMLVLFEDLGSTRHKFDFSICFASRHYPSIKIDHSQELVLDEIGGHKEDISLYVQRRLKLRHVSFKQELAAEIGQRSSGVFLWVVLVVGILNKNDDYGNIHILRDQLLAIPTNLADLFDELVDRDKLNDKLVPMIQWTLFSGRPLSAIELYHAILMYKQKMTDTPTIVNRTLVEERVLRDFILTSSKGFLETTFSSKTTATGGAMLSEKGPFPEELGYQFIHESVREYFLGHGLRRLDPSLGDNVAGASHHRLAQTCIDYQHQLSKIVLDAREPEVSVLLDYPFLEYVRHYGGLYHADRAEREGTPQETFCVVFPVRDWLLVSMALERNSRVFHNFMKQQATLLHILVYHGYEALVLREIRRHDLPTSPLSTSGRYIDAHCGPSGTALHIAVEHNKIRLARMLLANGVDANAQCDGLGTALHVAMRGEDTKLIRTLLSGGADVNTLCVGLGTALHVVASRCSKMKKEPDVPGPWEGIYERWRTSYYKPSSRKPSEDSVVSATGEIIRTLLSGGADVNSQCSGKGTPLNVAAKFSDPNIISLLLANGADINIRSGNNGTALETAIRFERHESMRCLLAYGTSHGIWGVHDIGKILVAAAGTYAYDGRTIHVIAEHERLAKVQVYHFLAALAAAARRGCGGADIVLALLQYLPTAALCTSEYQRLIEATDATEQQMIRHHLQRARDEQSGNRCTLPLDGSS